MQKAKEYLEILYQKEPQLFLQPLKISVLTENDLKYMEEKLGYVLPEQFADFLKSYQLPSMTMFITFCGDLASSLWNTFSREKNGYITNETDDFVVVDFK